MFQKKAEHSVTQPQGLSALTLHSIYQYKSFGTGFVETQSSYPLGTFCFFIVWRWMSLEHCWGKPCRRGQHGSVGCFHCDGGHPRESVYAPTYQPLPLVLGHLLRDPCVDFQKMFGGGLQLQFHGFLPWYVLETFASQKREWVVMASLVPICNVGPQVMSLISVNTQRKEKDQVFSPAIC